MRALPPLARPDRFADPPRVFGDRYVGLVACHAAVFLNATHASEPIPKSTSTEPQPSFQAGFSSDSST